MAIPEAAFRREERNTMTNDTVQIEQSNGIAVVRLNRPPVNAIELELLRAVEQELDALESHVPLPALVVTGSGKCFSAGLDLRTVPFYDAERQQEMVMAINRLLGRLYSFSRPVVAAINGHAIAGGLLLALACDYRIASKSQCTLGLSEVRAGVPFPVAAAAIVKAELSPPVTRRLTLWGRNMASRDALAAGIIDEIQPQGKVVGRALTVATDLAALPPTGYARIKRQFRAAAIEEIERVVAEGNDPLVHSWIGSEGRAAAAGLLVPRRNSH